MAVDELGRQKVPRTRAGRYRRDAFYRFSHGLGVFRPPSVVASILSPERKEAEVVSRWKNSPTTTTTAAAERSIVGNASERGTKKRVERGIIQHRRADIERD